MGGAPEQGVLCQIQGSVQQFGSMASILWVVAISGTIDYLMSAKELPTRKQLKKMLYWMHIVIWTFSAITTVVPFFTETYAPSGGWCWFKGSEDGVIHTVWRYLLFYVWVWVAIAWLLVFYVRTWLKLRKLEQVDDRRMSASSAPSGTFGSISSGPEGGGFSIDSTPDPAPPADVDGNATATNQQQQGSTAAVAVTVPENKKDTKRKKALSRMGLFPLVLVMGYLFGTIRRIYEAASDEPAPFWLALLQVIFYAMMPVFDSIIYGMTKAVRKNDMKVLRRVCCRKGDE